MRIQFEIMNVEYISIAGYYYFNTTLDLNSTIQVIERVLWHWLYLI